MKVLIVEDDPLLVEMVKAKLKKDGYEVFSAFNGEEGLCRVKECFPDVIILDINMPIMNGFELLKILKKDNVFQKIPVILFSSTGDKEDNLEMGKRLGASGFLVKSQLSLNDIPAKIKEVIGQK
ncbi:MAG TPA: response regulator [Candidatus Paceibacterota bacterium]|nr:response regulator [Candidatus Paceibacterota bacterium]